MNKERRDLMTRRDAALKAKDITTYQNLTTAISKLPMLGIRQLTAEDIAKWNRRKHS